MRGGSARPAPGQAGFALLLVLWSLGLLALLGSTITAAGRSETGIAGNLLAAANAQAAADAGVAVAAFHLLDASDSHWPANGPARHFTVGASEVTLTMDDERSRVDPNDATAGLLAALLRKLDVADPQAGTLGNAILDWRVANDTGLSAGYAAAGRRYGPPHEPFQSIDELGLVIGMSPAVLERLRPHLSLYLEQTPTADQADPVVASAIADAVKRDELTVNDDQTPGPLIVRVTATARNRGASFTRAALLRMNGIATQPYEVLDWGGG